MLNGSQVIVENKNDTILSKSFDFSRNPNLVDVTISCAVTCLWFLFITFYNSHVLGFIVTKIISKFYLKDGYIHIGSFSVSLLSGKIMFKNVQYVTKDYSFHIVDGLAIFKWWLMFDSNDWEYYKNLKRDIDLNKVERCRLVLYMNGLEFHLYNRSDLYKNIQDILKCERYGDAGTSAFSADNINLETKNNETPETTTFSVWRELFPLVQMKIRSGKLAIGNRLLETTLWVHFNSGDGAYSFPDAPSALDNFTHFLRCNCSDVRMLLSNSPGYKGVRSEPPSFMGDGFVVLQSGRAVVSYYQDEPGLVPQEMDTSSASDPEWGLDVKFYKSATIRYGPWVDQQRFAIQKYFFPSNFQELSVTKPVELDESRVHSGFDVNVEFPKGTTFDMLFSKNEETSAIHICCGDIATFHYYQPWIVHEYGYSNNIVARFQQIEVSTSMPFQKLIECDVVEVILNMTIPRMWNCFQRLNCEIWFTRTTCCYINDQKNFINDLMSDWSATEPPDIAKFIPYEWEFQLYIRDFELILLANEFNWIDCTNENENNELALCGETLDITFVLSYIQFLPETVETKFFFRGETVILRSFLPESNTLRKSVISLSQSSNRRMYPKSKNVPSAGTSVDDIDGPDKPDKEHDGTTFGASTDEQLSKGWRRRTGDSDDWVDVWSVPVLIMNLYYKYHPQHWSNEEISKINKSCGLDYSLLEPSKLESDVITVELEAGPSAIRIFGSFWRQFFIGIKNNYFGSYDLMHEFNAVKAKKDVKNTAQYSNSNPSTNKDKNHKDNSPEKEASEKDMRHYRPFEANVTLVLLELQAELSMHTCSELPSPQVFSDKITFEMHKTFKETRLQLIVSPVTAIVQDALKRPSDQTHLSKGFLALSGLQFRGHAMFSDKDIPLGTPTVEYAWLMELQCGKLTGKITPLQLQSLLIWANTFMLHIKDEENVMVNPDPVVKCPHGQDQLDCTYIVKGHKICPSEDVLKYRMFRLSIEAIDIFISEVECACNVQASPIRFSTCNSTSHETLEGGSFFINELTVRQFVQQLNFGLDDSAFPQYIPLHSNSWVEVGIIGLGPITADIQELGKDTLELCNQVKFLKLHDKKSKRLWFLWSFDKLKTKLAADRCRSKICACVGGCNFFDTNNNGVRFFTNQSLDASNEKYTHYGSESLWGGQTDVGNSVKDIIRKKSDAISTSNSNLGSTGKVLYRHKKAASSVDKAVSSGADTPDLYQRSSSFMLQTAPSAASKLACDRSRSVLGNTISQTSLHKRTESDDGTFYSCASEADLPNRTKSQRSARKGSFPANISMKSGGSSISYVSAVSSADLLDQDEVDGPFYGIGPLVTPGLLLAYTHYMQPITCINWRQNIPSNLRRNFNLLKNLKFICPIGCHSNLPNMPSFNPSVQGKLPFIIVPKNIVPADRHAKVSNHSSDSSSPHKDSNPKKTFISIKLHQRVSLVLTPLLVQALDRYTSCLKSFETNYHVLHVLDSLHAGCIDKSKNSFVENAAVDHLTNSMDEKGDLARKLMEIVPPSVATVGIDLPEISVIFFQISSEMYIPSEQSSLSGQCGSEYSDCDIKNTGCVLMAARFSNLTLNLHRSVVNDNLFNSSIIVSQKYQSINVGDMFLNKCKKIITTPSITAFTGHLKCLQTQVLYLEGNEERQVNVTSIPTSSIQFHVLRGGELNFNPASIMESGKQEVIGKIIFEGGVEGIDMNMVLQKHINGDLIKVDSDKCNNNYTKMNENSQTKMDGKPECTVIDVAEEEDKKVDTKPDAKSDTQSDPKSDDEPTAKLGSDIAVDFDSESSIGSFNSTTQLSSTRKGYIALDVDSGEFADTSDVDGDDEHEDEEDAHVSISTSSPKNAVRFSKKAKKGKVPEVAKEEKKVEPVILKDIIGTVNLRTMWINLAAPTHLRNIYHEEVQNLNLVTVIVPALSCWIPPIVDFLDTVDICTLNHINWMRSVLACFMGQGLPESLVKKHNISCAVNQLSQFLQEEYSSQLVYVMRKQSDGHRILSIKKSLAKMSYKPKPEDLLTGIHALARQWKCMIIGAEVPESTFGTSHGGSKKHVVGRGRLTEKDLNILMKSSEAQSSVSENPSIISPVEVVISDDLSPVAEGETNTDSPFSENHALLSSIEYRVSDGDEGNSRKSRLELEMDQSLYHWMSKSPVSTALNSPLKEMSADQTDMLSENDKEENLSEKMDKNQQLDILRSNSPMVSVPTSGVQLAKAAVVFNCILSVVGIKAAPSTPVETSSKGSFSLDKLQINLINSEVVEKDENAEIDCEETLPAFLLEHLLLTVQAKGGKHQHTDYSSSLSRVDHVTNEVKFYIDIRQVHQHLDFKFVRLLLQVTETMHVVKEQKKFAQKNIDSAVCDEKSESWEKANMDLTGGIEEMPKSWRNMYNVMNLYKILHEDDFSPIDVMSPSSPPSLLRRRSLFNKASMKKSTSKEIAGSSPKSVLLLEDIVPTLSLTGAACLRKGKLTASIGGLDLDFEMKQMSATYIKSRKKMNADEKDSSPCEVLASLSIHLNRLTICLLESIRGNETMLTCRVVKSHALHTTISKPSSKLAERSLLAIGPISVEIPQHPGALRSIVTQFTARLQTHYMEFDGYRLSRSTGNDKMVEETSIDIGSARGSNLSTTTNSMFRVTSDTIQVSAALLPSLNVEYKIDKVTGWGSINGKVKFFFHLPSHVLAFDTKVQLILLPTRTHIALPPIKVEGSYIEIHSDASSLTPNPSVRGHSYLPVQVNIGPLVHNLSTDLLNHLIFLQKGFAKEVNDVVLDVDTNEPIPLWKMKSEEEMMSSQPMIYSIKLKIQSICITATTPSSTGVRLETGEVVFELSNQSPASSVLSSPHYPSSKMYGSANVYLSLSLGQFNKVQYPATEQDLSVFANFHTSLAMKNSAHENTSSTANKETIFINLDKPQLFVMPAAVDKGVLVYLHYKNAYNLWVEQRSALSTEYSTFAEHILRRFPSKSSTDTASSYLFLQVCINNMGVGLPLKETTVLPTTTLAHGLADIEPGTALLITIAETSVTCCNSGSFVSTGLFRRFCIRFAENFDHTAENWCSDVADNSNTNTYVIPEGSYEVCSRTINSPNASPIDVILPGKWVMTFFWKMRGIDVNIDVNIGKRLNLLTNVLTAITGDSDVADLSSVAEAEGVLDVETESKFKGGDNDDDDNVYDVVDVFHDSGNLDIPDGSNLLPVKDSLQRQLSHHTRRVDQLRRTNASPEVISKEVKTLQEIETIYKNQFFKDVRKKFRRQSRMRTASMKRKSLTDLKRHSLYSPVDNKRVTSTAEYYDNEIELVDYDNGYDTVDSPRIPDTVIYNLTGSPNRYGINDTDSIKRSSYLDSEVKTSSEEIRPGSHVKFSESTYDIRSDGSGNMAQPQHLRSTALDFELNVVVDIDSGKCTFHTCDNDTKDEDFNQFVTTRDLDRRHSDHEILKDKKVQSMYHRPARTVASVNSSDNTVILIPGVNARVHYLSTNMVDKVSSETFDPEVTENSSSRSAKHQVKIADLNALILIQSISKEMMVRPSLLDFLEKALEPIMEAVEDVSSETKSSGSILSSSGSSLYSFPVNVSVLIRIDPSDIRFSCLPISKVECLLRIPSLDFAITQTHAPYITPIVPSPRKKYSTAMKDGVVTNQSSSGISDSDFTSGFSFTLCLSRFSFCIFHPYGAQYGSTTDSRLSNKSMFADQKKDTKRQSLPISGRKDSLSLNVEFIKFNLFRKTMKVPIAEIMAPTSSSQEFRTEVGVSAICDIGSASFNYDMRRLNEILEVPKAWYKRGLVQRIFLGKEGSYATQSSLLQNNKPQYTDTSSREDSAFSVDRAVSDLQLHNSLKPFQPPKKGPGLSSHRRAVSGGSSFFSSLMSPFPLPRTSTTGSRKDIMFAYEPTKVKSSTDFTYSRSLNDSHPEEESFLSHSSTCNEWETNVVVAFKVARIDVSTNMGNVMGQATWSTNDLTANCNVLLNNSGRRMKVFDVSIRQSSMEAHGGVIGVYAELYDIKTDITLDENLAKVPRHSAILSMKAVELRLDYMGSSIIMAMLSMLKLKMEDDWFVPDLSKGDSEGSSNMSRLSSDSSNGGNKSEIMITCDACWDELQLIMSRSTTPDIVKIVAKLEDFFDQQHRNSVRALSTLRKMNRSPNYMSDTLSSSSMKEEKVEKKTENDNGLKYQHWMEILNGLYGIKFRNMAVAMPDRNIALGGKLCLRGNFVSLTCFHGVNFRSQNWGLFTIRGPCIEFTTHNRAFEKSCQVMRGKSTQNLTFSLDDSAHLSLSERRKSVSNLHDFMATVRRVSRGSRNPPSLGAHVQEWMMFVSTISENDMPTANTTNKQTANEKFSHTKVTSSIRKVSFAPKFRYENESEVIFALPRLSLQLSTEHDLPMTSLVAKMLCKEEQIPMNFQLKPSNHTVDIRFISDFDDSLTVNVSLLIYLHDLILNYMKEKEASVTVSSTRTQRGKTSDATSPPPVPTDTPKKEPVKRTDSIKKEEKYREFRTQEWKLEPKVSVLTWGGSRMDPINIEWVLEKLGFMHAALTIPKWMQRGALDPMDVVLAKLVGQVIAHMVEKEVEDSG